MATSLDLTPHEAYAAIESIADALFIVETALGSLQTAVVVTGASAPAAEVVAAATQLSSTRVHLQSKLGAFIEATGNRSHAEDLAHARIATRKLELASAKTPGQR